MKNLQFNPYQCETGRVGSKRSKPIPVSPHDAELKSCPIPIPPPLRCSENPHGVKRGGAGQVRRGKIAILIATSTTFSQQILSGKLL